MPMRCLWIDEGADPDYDRIAPYLFTRLYFSARDPITVGYLDNVRSRHYEVGVYRAWNWAQLEANAFGEALVQDVNRFGAVRILANVETHDMMWVAQFLNYFRREKPETSLAWTMEGFQGPLLANIRDTINKARVLLVPQAYDGAMNEYDPYGVVRDLVHSGFSPNIIRPFYHAGHLRRGWDGFAFRQGLLA